MSIQDRLTQWIKDMGYDGCIPDSLSKICNPSTAFIWEQIISSVKSRQEVASVRRNIIIHRLRTKTLQQQHEFSYPVKEIEGYINVQAQENKIKCLENNIEKTEATIDDLLRKNKATYVSIDGMKKKLKEKREKIFLLEKKSKMIEEDIILAQERLALAQNLTPVEMDESSNEKEVAETLQKCAEKLKKITEGISLPFSALKVDRDKCLSVSTTAMLRTPKCSTANSNFSKYINQSKYLMDSTMLKSHHNKENIEIRDLNSTEPQNVLNEPRNIKKKPIRESLGLLPDGCLDECDDHMTEFLLTPTTNFSSVRPGTGSVAKNLDLLFSSHEKIDSAPDCEISSRLSHDKYVKDTVEKLLHKENRQLILKKCEHIYDGLLNEMRNLSLNCGTILKSTKVFVEQDDLKKLYLSHIKTELEKDRHKAVSKRLQEQVRKTKEGLYFALSKKNKGDELRKVFELQIEEAELTGANNFLYKHINAVKKTEISNDVNVIATKIMKVKEEMFREDSYIRMLIESIYKVFENMKNYREEASSTVRSLGPYVVDLSWASRLNDRLITDEINIFENFPTEYNRRFLYSGKSKVYFRNMCNNSVPSELELSSHKVMLSRLLDIPFSPTEDVLLNILRTKVIFNVLRTSHNTNLPKEVEVRTYLSQEFLHREDYIETVAKQLRSLISSSSARCVASAPDQLEEVVRMWIEMPIRNYICEKRLVDGQNYQFYEKMFDNFYKKM